MRVITNLLRINHLKPFNQSLWLKLIQITMLSLFCSFALQHLLVSDNLYFNALAEQMTYEQIQKLITQNHEWSWLGYVILLVFNLIKFSLVASCLNISCYLVTNHWKFKAFFRIAVQAELVLLLPTVIKLVWFLFVQTDYSLNDLQFFYPLSLLNLFEPQAVEPYLLYPLQLFNLFELLYWVALAHGVAQAMGWSVEQGLGMVAASYGTGLLVWIVFIMFLTVSLS